MLQITPQTPKIPHRTPPTRTRLRRSANSGGISKGSGSSGSTSSSGGRNVTRPIRSRPSHEETSDLEYSTPRANRILNRRRYENGKIAHLIYHPLVLDENSSSESGDSFARLQNYRTQCITPPTTPPEKKIKLEQQQQQQQQQQPQSPQQQPQRPLQLKPPPQPKQPQPGKLSQHKQKQQQAQRQSQKQQLKPTKKTQKSTFIPGQCNIEELFRYYNEKKKLEEEQATGKPSDVELQTTTHAAAVAPPTTKAI